MCLCAVGPPSAHPLHLFKQQEVFLHLSLFEGHLGQSLFSSLSLSFFLQLNPSLTSQGVKLGFIDFLLPDAAGLAKSLLTLQKKYQRGLSSTHICTPHHIHTHTQYKQLSDRVSELEMSQPAVPATLTAQPID